MDNRDRVLLVLGFLLVHRASSHAYLSVFGLADTNVGYIADAVFIFAVTVAIALVSLVVFMAARNGVLRPLCLPYTIPSAIAVVSFIPSFAGVGLSSWPWAGCVVAGILYAASFSLSTFSWYELFACERADVGTILLVFSVLGSSLLASALSSLPDVAVQVLDVIFVTVGWGILRYLRGRLADDVSRVDGKRGRGSRGLLHGRVSRAHRATVDAGARELLVPLYALIALELATGLLNITATGDLLATLQNMPIWASTSLGAVAFIVVVLALKRNMSADLLYLRVFPILLAALLALLAVGEPMGAVAGVVMLVAFNFLTFSVNYSMFDIHQRTGTPIYCLVGVSNIGARIGLALGLGLGVAFTGIAHMTSAALPTIVAVFTVYILSMVALSLSGVGKRNVERHGSASAEKGAALDSVSVAQVDVRPNAVAGDHAKAVKLLSRRYALTGRETDVLDYLARGWSARQMAATLVISENTVWTHVKHIYAKTGTSSKQEVINMYEEELAKCREGRG